jgi:hypothetical protein
MALYLAISSFIIILVMMSRQLDKSFSRLRLFFIVVTCLLNVNAIPALPAKAETTIRSERVRLITQFISTGDFDSAMQNCRQLMVEEPGNLVNSFLMGLTYFSITSQYRNDLFADSVIYYLDNAIFLAQKSIHGYSGQAENYYILGSAYGCRALFRSIHGGWWGAFQDGRHSCSNLERAYGLDSTLTDALAGIGAYHYWKSAKTKIISWLPFASDKRDQGISEIIKAMVSNGIMAANAKKSLLSIYFNQKRFNDVLAMGNSLDSANFLDPNSHLHLARALIELKNWGDAERVLDEIQAKMGKSNYYDLCGASEVLLLRARILLGRGDTIKAKQFLQEIISMEHTCKSNAYFRQTLSNARILIQ